MAEEAKIKGANLKRVSIVQQDSTGKLDALESNQCTNKNETPEEYVARLDNVQKKKYINPIIRAWQERAEAMGNNHDSSDDESTSTSALDSGGATDDEWDKDKDEYQRNLNLQQDSTKRSKSPDSGIESRATSPSYSEQKTEESPSSRVDSPQVNNVDPVNSGVQKSSIPPIEDRIAKFGEKALQYQKENVALGPRVL